MSGLSRLAVAVQDKVLEQLLMHTQLAASFVINEKGIVKS